MYKIHIKVIELINLRKNYVVVIKFKYKENYKIKKNTGILYLNMKSNALD